jgi:hypothetical protein
MSESDAMIEVDSMSIDQLAGAIVLVLGAVGSLLLVVWQSRCACRCRIGCSDKCYIFDCSREPPPEEPKKDEEKKALGDVGEANSIERSPKKEIKLTDEEIREGTYPLVPPSQPSPEPEIIQ